MFRLSVAQIQFMAVDNTHTKYLHGSDKKAWSAYKDAVEAQNKLDNFLSGLNIPELKEGEEFEIPTKREKKSKNKK